MDRMIVPAGISSILKTHPARELGTALLLFLHATSHSLIIALLGALVSGAASADDRDRMFGRLVPEMSGLLGCASSVAGIMEPGEALSGKALSSVAGCTANRALASMLGAAVNLVEDQGQTLFGEHFRIDNGLGLSLYGTGLRGDLDALIPFHSLSSPDHEWSAERASFMQSGLTRWTDGRGFRRNDVRHGLVHRFAAPNGLEDGIYGIWAFFQHNLERGHERLVAGMDYSGRWGTGAVNYFKPTTDWRPGRSGYEERALEGMELDLRFHATSTVTLNAALGRWEAADGSGGSTTRSRLGVRWRPHPWLSLGGGWTGSGSGDDTVTFRAAVAIPLGGAKQERMRWQGLGHAGRGTEPWSTDVWRSVDTVGRIEVAERSVPSIDSVVANSVSVRFLQDSVDTGATVRVEVSLSSPAVADTRFTVRLVPGSGADPAVPGVDYVDETVEVTIFEGEISAVASFQLLNNPSLQSARMLGVAVDPIT